MQSAIQIFNHEDFGNVRVLARDGETWFVGKDVCDVLGYSNPRDAIARHCKASDAVGFYDSIGREQKTTIIPERDLYRLIMRSKLPAAEKFEDWVVSEVLPTLRRNGSYIMPQVKQPYQPTDYDWEQLAIRRKEVEAKEKQIDAERSKLLQEIIEKNSAMLPPETLRTFSVLGVELLTQTKLKNLLPDVVDNYYTATQIAEECGSTANTIGKLSLKYGLKTKDTSEQSEYGVWKWAKAANSNKEVPQFLYNEKGKKWYLDYFNTDADTE